MSRPRGLRSTQNILIIYSSLFVSKAALDSIRISIDPNDERYPDPGYQGSRAGFQETQPWTGRAGWASIVAQKRPPREHRARSLAGSHAFVMFIKYRLAGRHRRHRMTSTQLARISRSGSRPREPFALIGIATIKCVYSYVCICVSPRCPG